MPLCFLPVCLHVMDHSVFQIVSAGDDLVHASPSSPACELHQDRDHVLFLCPQSLEHSERDRSGLAAGTGCHPVVVA